MTLHTIPPESVLQAMHDGQFRVVLEPQIDLNSTEVVGFEALARWQHPEHGLLSPDAFLAQIEGSGAMMPFTEALFERLMSVRRSLRAADFHGRLSFNVPQELLETPDLAECLKAIAERHGEDVTGMVVEVTESAAISDSERLLAGVQALRTAGFELCIDDFWTGYSGLDKAYLGAFSEVKVDRSLTALVEHNDVAVAGVASILAFARNLGWRCVVEGIEDRAVLNRLMALGFKLGQGFLFTRPIAERHLQSWLAHYRSLCAGGGCAAAARHLAVGLPSFGERDAVALAKRRHPVWVFDLDAMRMEWANPAGLHFWEAASLDALRQRSFDDMSAAALCRLRAYRTRLRVEPSVAERWVLVPGREPRAAFCVMHGRRSDEGRFLMVVEAHQGLEMLDAGDLGHDFARDTAVLCLILDPDGHILWRNPAAEMAFGAQAKSLHVILAEGADALLKDTSKSCDMAFLVRCRTPAGEVPHLASTRVVPSERFGGDTLNVTLMPAGAT